MAMLKNLFWRNSLRYSRAWDIGTQGNNELTSKEIRISLLAKLYKFSLRVSSITEGVKCYTKGNNNKKIQRKPPGVLRLVKPPT